MNSFMNTLKTAARKRAEYRRIVSEIENMSEREAMDIDIARSNAHSIARQAVYGI